MKFNLERLETCLSQAIHHCVHHMSALIIVRVTLKRCGASLKKNRPAEMYKVYVILYSKQTKKKDEKSLKMASLLL